MKYQFSDLIDLERMQRIVKNFQILTNVPLHILDSELKIMPAQQNGREICAAFCQESKQCIWQELQLSASGWHKCEFGLLLYCLPLIVDGNFLAAIYAGPFLRESAGEEACNLLLEPNNGKTNTVYWQAMQHLPVFVPGEMAQMLNALMDLVALLSELALQRLLHFDTLDMFSTREVRQQAESLAEPSMELKLAKRRRAVAASEGRFARVFFSSPAPMAIISRNDGFFWEVNEALLSVVGFNKKDLIGHDVSELGLLPEAGSREKIIELFQQQGAVRNLEFRYRRKNGSEGIGLLSAEGVKIDFHQYMLCTIIDITERKHYERQIQNMAYYDLATGLPNRRLFADRLESALMQAAQQKEMVAMFFLDFSDYRKANGSLLPEQEVKFVREIADRLICSSPEIFTVARLDPDAFAFFMPHISRRDMALRFANRILDSFQLPFMLEKKKIRVGMTVGINFFPDDGDVAKIFLTKADRRIARWQLAIE